MVPLTKNKPSGGDESRVASLCVDFCRRHAQDLDSFLSPAQKAELLAFKVLIQTRLEVAALFSAWLEPSGFNEMRKVTGGKLPFPLSYFIPRQLRGEVKVKLGPLDASEVSLSPCTARPPPLPAEADPPVTGLCRGPGSTHCDL